MNKNEFLKTVTETNINYNIIKEIEQIYGCLSSSTVKQLVSVQKETLFFDDFRLLSNDEIINATEQLHVDFVTKNILPLIDCGDNDFIVFHIKTNKWSRFNIVDECSFKERDSLEEVL
mgnify:CR=1 FL=1